ncbi:MAG TPA: protein phosphatase 2C domain-containing protein [Mycobacteriales bacterium]
MDVTVASRTGRSRPASEDRWVAVTGAAGLLLAVADGMGGTIAGGPAADAALAGLVEALAVTTQAVVPAGSRTVEAPGETTPSAAAVEPRTVEALAETTPSAAAVPAGSGTVEALAVTTPSAAAVPTEPRTVEAGAAGWLAESGVAEPDGRTTPMAIVAPEPGPDLAAAVAAAHERVRRLATDGMPVPLRPGTTLTAALVTGRRLRLAHLGDSSCWLLRKGRLRRLTEEHTHAAQLVAAGAVQPGSVAQRRLEGMLTRFAGMPGSACPQLVTVRLRAGDRLLVATDGVTRALTVPALATLLGRPGITATDLVDAASDAGGRDDATALLAAVPGGVPGDMDTTRPDLNTRYVAEGAR